MLLVLLGHRKDEEDALLDEHVEEKENLEVQAERDAVHDVCKEGGG